MWEKEFTYKLPNTGNGCKRTKESGLHMFVESLKLLFSQLSRLNDSGIQRLDEESLESFKRRFEDAATTIRFLIDHIIECKAEYGTDELSSVADGLTTVLRCTYIPFKVILPCVNQILVFGFYLKLERSKRLPRASSYRDY